MLMLLQAPDQARLVVGSLLAVKAKSAGDYIGIV